jgi:hypothetical protein
MSQSQILTKEQIDGFFKNTIRTAEINEAGEYITSEMVQASHEALRRHVEDEREACAKIAEEYGHAMAQENESLECGRDGFEIAKAIRERR